MQIPGLVPNFHPRSPSQARDTRPAYSITCSSAGSASTPVRPLGTRSARSLISACAAATADLVGRGFGFVVVVVAGVGVGVVCAADGQASGAALPGHDEARVTALERRILLSGMVSLSFRGRS